MNGRESCFAENAEIMGASRLRTGLEHDGESLGRKEGFTLRFVDLWRCAATSLASVTGVFEVALAQLSFVPSVGQHSALLGPWEGVEERRQKRRGSVFRCAWRRRGALGDAAETGAL